MDTQDFIALAVLLPLIGTIMIWMSGQRPNQRELVTIITSILTFLCVLQVLPPVLAGENPTLVITEIIPGLPLAFVVEPLGMMFALIASFLWIVTSFYAIGYMRGHNEPNQTRFYMCFAIAISSAIAVAFSSNMFTLFIAYEVLTLSTYPLVTHNQDEEAKRAGRTYLGILLTTSVGFLLIAILWTWFAAGTLDFTKGGILKGKIDDGLVIVMLFLYMYGIGKAALMPIHRWLPAAMVAPTPVSALLHAVAVVKAGVFTVLKVIIYIFGADFLTETGASIWLMYVAGGTVLLASLVAITKDNLKARLAYSTVSQLSYVVLAGALATSFSLVGGAMHIAMHAFGKITLFFCAGAIMVASHKTQISQMRGLGWKMPYTFVAFLIGSLSVIGLPPLGGSWSKWYIALGAADAEQLIFIAVLMISSLLNIGYLIPVFARGFFGPREEEDGEVANNHPPEHDPRRGDQMKRHSRIAEAPLMCVIPLWVTAIGCFALFLYADRLYAMLAPIVSLR
ncbi:MAG: Hydrogenase-4 component B [Alphaproteobacteria bacterium MarineAlpha11_Bin1]|nr:MAG: Hydrogenase-4 component B [Alphaproteobacteria bacterium MarineAlpha11_Bin1]|tara:strand:- start:412 stop:1938 length:1527 start_codon:yes stop_codon:yes gene_type:complete